jgi:tellurite resistance protein
MFPIEVEGRQAMNIKETALMVALMTVSGLGVAQSGGTTSTPSIDQRQANQQQRIDQGVKSGALTPKETARLEKGQQRVQRMETTAMADGKVKPKERRRIAHAQNQQSKKIYREKHDRQRK